MTVLCDPCQILGGESINRKESSKKYQPKQDGIDVTGNN